MLLRLAYLWEEDSRDSGARINSEGTLMVKFFPHHFVEIDTCLSLEFLTRIFQ